MPRVPSSSIYGTLNLLILKSLEDGPLHGLGVAEWIEHRSGAELEIKEGALYPALHRLRNAGLIEDEWAEAPSGRPAKFYALTRVGREELGGEIRRWRSHAGAVSRLLGLAAAAEALDG
ncbi:MAG TPA: PadR family transcriptional regulator [Longimicrobiales bacterium]|nr:PadR family transcriptional regulator [Longimicrobiales bacterium]